MKFLKTLSGKPLLLVVYVLVALALVLNIFVAGYWLGRKQEFSKHFLKSSAQANTVLSR